MGSTLSLRSYIHGSVMLIVGALVLPATAAADWGENWGTMQWGAAPAAVPDLSPWSLVVLVAVDLANL